MVITLKRDVLNLNYNLNGYDDNMTPFSLKSGDFQGDVLLFISGLC